MPTLPPGPAWLFQRLFPHPRHCGMSGPRVTLLVAAGGAAGAAARAGADLMGPASGGGFPWTTWTINLAGSAAMGLLMVLLSRHPKSPMWAGPVLGSGFLGGFTTFSAFATVVGALAAAAGGAAAASRLPRGGTGGRG